MLTVLEIERLFALMRSLRGRGMGLVYVSHKLAEVKAVCDRVIVLKDGGKVREAPIAEIEPPEMARCMVGRELREIYPPRRDAAGPVVLEVRGLSSPGAFRDVTFSVRAGEILGLAGLVGAGRTEVAEALMGLRPSSGAVRVAERDAHARSASAAVRRGLGYLSEDRQGTGVVTAMGVAENMTLVSLPRYCSIPFVVDLERMLEGALQAYQESGRKDLKIAFGGAAKKEIVKRIMDGDPLAKADATYPPDVVATGVSVAVVDLRGRVYEGFYQKKLPLRMILPSELITKENAKEYYVPGAAF